MVMNVWITLLKHMPITVVALGPSSTTILCMILWLCKTKKLRRQYMGWVSINFVHSMIFFTYRYHSMVFENKWTKAKTPENRVWCMYIPSLCNSAWSWRESWNLISSICACRKDRVTNLSADVLGNIWSKAERILQTPNSICDVQGC